MSSGLPDFITFFLNPAHYDHPVDRVELVQTHISYVLLAGDFVYKFKKPVNFGFLDFTTLDKRRHYCQQELLLNRRLCPDIYLDVFFVCRQGTGFSLSGTGEPVEYGVRMKMMPQERMMGRVIERGELNESHINDIVATLVPFYDRAAGGSEIAGFGTARAMSVNVLENFDQTRDFIGKGALQQSQFDAISSYARTFLQNEALFLERSANRVKDCHGDLYSANICLAHKVHIFDCIEFNERFRYCDVASDVAFLAMDLDFHGLKELSDFFIDRFVAASVDKGLLAVLPFYKCYRAYVRGKIGLFTAHAPEVDEATRNKALAQAEKYFLLAEKYAG
jgi:aminoglycoside phosphotransferase family enzyme